MSEETSSWTAAQEQSDGDALLTGRHPFDVAQQIEAPLTLGYNGDAVGRALLRPGGEVVADVYEPNLANDLGSGACSFNVVLGAGPTDAVVLNVLSRAEST